MEASERIAIGGDGHPARGVARSGFLGLLFRGSTIRGLLWCEWFAHSRMLLWFLGAWLVLVWTLPLFAHSGWILFFGVIYAFVAGPVYGGGDVLEGCEEFSFSLPATRGERFRARLLLGCGTLLIFTLMDVMALGLDLPQMLAKVYVDTGIIKPFPVFKPRLLYGLVFAVPLCVFAFSFSISAVTASRTMIVMAWFWSLVCTLAALNAGLLYEDAMRNRVTGYFSFPLLVGLSVLVLTVGHRLYSRKEVSGHAAPMALPARWWAWALMFMVGAAIAAGLVMALIRQLPNLVQ